ncbi:hypothetical protein [Hymenobacter actinosclerus]|uniref:Uncharacterized protein n=1 Tax=Hymenobacter actinosclerus TaxID=82805 RepID=A0A1I0B923_9BACT|nr:hypothetical protein [Hymenobacter actinosclerus]SET03214.1 hypothetical protein SAMN04487998_0978 [Hymenobacter actinosclerus]
MKRWQIEWITAILVVLALLSTDSRAQSVVLRGTATATGGRSVQIEVNDTLRKIWQAIPDQPVFSQHQKELADQALKQIQTIITTGRYVLATDSAGQFSLTVRLRDSVQFSAYRHFPQRFAVRDLQSQPQIRIQLVPQPCKEYMPCQEDAPATFVFIGRKVRVNRAEQPYYCNRISMDSKFVGRYQVLSNVSGLLPDSVLEFTAYDHYGWPGFSRYETVLLFVSRYCGEYVQQKYMYYPLYKTIDGRWASPVMASDLKHPMAKKAPKPHKIAFAAPVEIDIANFDAEWVKEQYPAPYYRIASGKAIAEYGNFVDELVKIQQQTVLKARGVKLK